MDYKAEYQAQMTALADSIREKAGTSGKMDISQMTNAVENIGNQSWTWYKNAVNYAGKNVLNTSPGRLFTWTLSGTKIKDCYVFCSFDVTGCSVLIAGRQMQDGEGWGASGDINNSKDLNVDAIPIASNVYSYYQSWEDGTSHVMPYWYLNGNTLYLLSYSQNLYVRTGTTSAFVALHGITIIGEPVLTMGNISMTDTYFSSGSYYRFGGLYRFSSVVREGDKSYRTLLPSGLEGKTAVFGIKMKTVTETVFSPITTTLQS